MISVTQNAGRIFKRTPAAQRKRSRKMFFHVIEVMFLPSLAILITQSIRNVTMGKNQCGFALPIGKKQYDDRVFINFREIRSSPGLDNLLTRLYLQILTGNVAVPCAMGSAVTCRCTRPGSSRESCMHFAVEPA
jgi:hypothetical protein